ncbi:MAG: hypothetical protein MPW14_05850 [Candidatus Manganitrophus sp.]|nr:MAG: hypothetical protein MPW14_05850 [Candidatus Manganitrophus sp.]
MAGRILSERRSLIIDDLSKVEVASPILRKKGFAPSWERRFGSKTISWG